ncbi:hypothetical protein GS518_18315 [Leptospira interrogans]|nr:hypothetical protein [Leptospira interrogans]EMG19703.1 hypothetical protein LEP1GSC150_1037 [Leptospira interrogans serovar Copenhageni str. LT2050]EMO04675.1 hypothetical protein LEP1GSC116_1819 [Leptospira interrogans serovar Icterohaemorrhagiae str. Verdun HP]OCC28226.1 Uncharacterized protein GNX_3303 [Leptospira interrogans serovar Canicola]AAS72276.1 conserved hypothetical protein [Leptospira interrogans serovar Copenhageni str. Fiocruz L1-130]ARB94348.1 hypothetical protein A6J42_01
MLQFLNTIEVNPYDYSEKEYDIPDTTKIENPEEWNEFWLQCISDRNLGNLKSIYQGSYLVDIRTIDDLELETILKTELEEVKFDECEDQVGSLDGGIVIKSENSIIITPMCCGDIGNLREWEKILESQNNIWKQLWIGHPWIFYRRANGFIEISNYTESNLDDFNDIQVEYKLTEEEFFLELKKIREQQDEF